MVRIWSPEPTAVTEAALLERIAAMVYAGQPPCSPVLVEMLSTLSHRILDDTALATPRHVALAYWLRPAALSGMIAELAVANNSGRIRAPRGLALHLPPANVDTVFVYSWALSALAGNTNVVRLTEHLTPETARLAATICAVVDEFGQSDRNLFCRFPYGGDLERSISRLVDLRLVWGGDAKVEAVSAVPIRPDGVSIGFPDRRSMAVLDSASYRRAASPDRDKLAAALFNDMFWFDQMGCSSPRIVVWLGDPGELAEDFYHRLHDVVRRRGYSVDPAVAMSKLTLANSLLAQGITTHFQRFSASLDVSRTADPAAAIAHPHGGGFVCDWVADSLDQLARVVDRTVQTITHFGLTTDDVVRLAEGISGRGGYRIVPVGQALEFDSTWDGVDLIAHMTRQIVVR
ncbi:hypothetical protein MSZK_42000 [Mycobacterium sp. shizuoka-1]|nr:hypothetical protein MSZK_42000 [Mycobacterium sp. shizuoka-1]